MEISFDKFNQLNWNTGFVETSKPNHWIPTKENVKITKQWCEQNCIGDFYIWFDESCDIGRFWFELEFDFYKCQKELFNMIGKEV